MQPILSPFYNDRPSAPPSLTVLATELSAQLLNTATEPQLLALLPLILHRLADPHSSSPLLLALQQRLSTSRRLKLRFLLLRRHPAFQDLQSQLRYASRAYDEELEPAIRTADCSRSNIFPPFHPPPTRPVLTVPVDMVDLQSEEFLCRMVNAPSDNVNHLTHTPRRVAQQLMTPPMQPTDPLYTPDDAMATHTHTRTSSSSLHTDASSTATSLAMFATSWTHLREQIIQMHCLSTITQHDNDRDEDLLNHANWHPFWPRMCVRRAADMLITHCVMTTMLLFNQVWQRHTPGDPLSAPLCVTADAVPVGARGGLLQALLHESLLSTEQFDAVLGGGSAARPDNLVGVKVDRLVRTAAGALTAGYVLGLHTPTGRELRVKDGVALVWRETVGGIADKHDGTGTGVDMGASAVGSAGVGRLVVPRRVRSVLRQVGMWDEFRKTCVKAFALLRVHGRDVVRCVAPLFERCGVPSARLWALVDSKASLYLAQTNASRAESPFRKWLTR